MSRGVYMKAMTDLERMGFVHYLAEPDLLIAELVPSDARDERGWVTTEYVQLFKEAVLVGNER
jgi:hypothetical protein